MILVATIVMLQLVNERDHYKQQLQLMQGKIQMNIGTDKKHPKDNVHNKSNMTTLLEKMKDIETAYKKFERLSKELEGDMTWIESGMSAEDYIELKNELQVFYNSKGYSFQMLSDKQDDAINSN
jgi:predicted nuclease with TOPRIM domain